MRKGDTPAGVACDVDTQHHADTPPTWQHHVSARFTLHTSRTASPAMLANLPPRDRLVRPVPVPTRRARLPRAEQHLRDAAVAEHNHHESPEELGEELPQREARLAPE